MRSALAARRIVILGDSLDCHMPERQAAKYVAGLAAQSVDMAISIGKLATVGVKAAVAAGMPSDSVKRFKTSPEAAEFLRSELRPGDLVLVHGWEGRHLERVVLAQLGTVSCWLERCYKTMPCEECSELMLVPFGTNAESRGKD